MIYRSNLDIPLNETNAASFVYIESDEAAEQVKLLKEYLVQKGEASTDLFGIDPQRKLDGILQSINQSLFGQDIYPLIKEKAAHLLYFIMKNHPFIDGNKRIAVMLFVYLLDKNGLLELEGPNQYNDRSLFALAVMVASSAAADKDKMIRAIIVSI